MLCGEALRRGFVARLCLLYVVLLLCLVDLVCQCDNLVRKDRAVCCICFGSTHRKNTPI